MPRATRPTGAAENPRPRTSSSTPNNPTAIPDVSSFDGEHNPDLIELTREPSFAGLHSDAKFRELVERIGWGSLAAD